MSDDDLSRWTLAGLARGAVIATLALATGAAMGYVVAHEPTPRPASSSSSSGPPPAPLAPPDEAKILAPLAIGGALGDFTILEIRPIDGDGLMKIVCEKDRGFVSLVVALRAEDGPAPPAEAPPYAVFYGTRNATSSEGERLAIALADILRKNGAKPPRKMRPFTPKPRPEPTL